MIQAAIGVDIFGFDKPSGIEMTQKFAASFPTSDLTYTTTHPWISFELDLSRAPARLWLMLGEARSKCAHLAGAPLQPKVAEHLHRVYLAKGVHATTAIEGNTLSERQVLERLEKGTDVVPASQQYLQVEIDNVIHVSNEIIDECEGDGVHPLTPDIVKRYNASVLSNLELDEHVVPGQYRETTVGVMDYRAPHCRDCNYLIARYCDWLNSETFATEKSDEMIVYGIIKAIVAHVYLAWIHPFGDGNGRTARLLEVRFLMEAGVPAPAVHLLSNHYNKTRSEYYRRLQEASRNGGDLTNFMVYALSGFIDQIRSQLATVRIQQWGVAWQNFVYEQFGQNKSIADKRQIALLLALSEHNDPVSVSKLRRLTPELAEMYAQKTPRTLARDLNVLVERDLVERTSAGVRAKKEIILAFLPRIKLGGYEQHLLQHIKMTEGSATLDPNALIEN